MRPVLTDSYGLACVACGQVYTSLHICPRCDRAVCRHCAEEDALCTSCAVARDKEEDDAAY